MRSFVQIVLAAGSSIDDVTRTLLLVPVLLHLSLSSSEGSAQEIRIHGPLTGACIARLDRYAVPAELEWAHWIAGGLSVTRSGARLEPEAAAAAGFEATVGVFEYDGFPSHHALGRVLDPNRPQDRNRLAELRMGPWVQGITEGAGRARIEGGWTAHLGTVGTARPWGELDVRLGAGYAARDGAETPYFALAMGWGYRWVFDRQSWGGACDPAQRPDAFADATFARLVTTARRGLEASSWGLAVALELTPTAVLVPLRCERRRERDQ